MAQYQQMRFGRAPQVNRSLPDLGQLSLTADPPRGSPSKSSQVSLQSVHSVSRGGLAAEKASQAYHPYGPGVHLPLLTRLRRQEANGDKPLKNTSREPFQNTSRDAFQNTSRDAPQKDLPAGPFGPGRMAARDLAATARSTSTGFFSSSSLPSLAQMQPGNDGQRLPVPSMYSTGMSFAPSVASSMADTSRLQEETARSSKSWGSTAHLEGLEAAEVKRMERLRRKKALMNRNPRNHITHSRRRGAQEAAIAADRQFVLSHLDNESGEARQARAAAFNDNWLRVLFAPIPDPRPLLSGDLEAQLPPKPMDAELEGDELEVVKEEEEAAAKVNSPYAVLSPPASPTAAMMSPMSSLDEDEEQEFEFELEELQEIHAMCMAFHHLVSPKEVQRKGPQVLTRASFCRLICCLDGLPVREHPQLIRAAAHFDRYTEKFTVDDEEGAAIVLRGVRMTSLEEKPKVRDLRTDPVAEMMELPICKLFKDLLEDMFEDMLRRGMGRKSTRKNTRSSFFGVLLPRAQGYARARAERVAAVVSAAMPKADKEKDKDTEEQDLQPQPEAVPEEPEKGKKGKKGEKGKKVEVEVKPVVEAPPPPPPPPAAETAEEEEGSRELFALTFAVMKGETLKCELLQPEVMRFMVELSPLFHILFEAYSDLPTPDGRGSMSLTALLRFCGDFGLFPDRVDYKTILWLYSNAEGCIESEPVADPVEPVSPGSPKTKDSKSGRKKGKKKTHEKEKDPTAGCVLHRGKWIQAHLMWMTADLQKMSEKESRTIIILQAIVEWMSSQGLSTQEVFAFIDKDGNGNFSLEELQIAVDFMDFDDPPTEEDMSNLFHLLLQPIPEDKRGAEAEVDLVSLQTALMTASQIKGASTNIFLKEMSKMSKEESNAAIFFRELYHIMELTQLTPEATFERFNTDRSGHLTEKELAINAHSLLRRTGVASSALSVYNPFTALDHDGDGIITKDKFIELINLVRKAERIKRMQEQKHPLFLAQGLSVDPNKGKRIFGHSAFMECVLKIGLDFLTFHGNATQAELSSFHKMMWLFVFLHWSFEQAKERAAGIPPPSPSRPGSRPRSRPQSRATRPYPKHAPPMRRLLNRHPRLFADALKDNLQLEMPGWAYGSADLGDVLLHRCVGQLEALRKPAEETLDEDLLDDDDSKQKKVDPAVFLAFDHTMVEIITSAGLQRG
mmetsp:Transcript_68976/g.121982  ORF Transcript_68976/g.121982 Transcript_68976/m.121982 type:complete len:1184 (+) Transcript_68976:25-3576(+)